MDDSGSNCAGFRGYRRTRPEKETLGRVISQKSDTLERITLQQRNTFERTILQKKGTLRRIIAKNYF